jgi:CRISPR/Cas system-associated exonuclease Cas4 (RecB family)
MRANDERKGRPSASALNRIMNCPGSFQAEQLVAPDLSDKDADTGNRIHEAIFRNEIEALPDAERDTAYQCMLIRDEIVREFGGDPKSGQYFVEREKRIWFRDNSFSGQCDHVVIDGDRALIVDYKTGYLGAPPAQRNLQMAGYALLLSYEYGCDEIHVAIVQPRAFPRKSVSVYRWEDIKAAEEAVTKMLHNAMAESPPRNAGEWCHHCRARATCREAQSVVSQLVAIAETGKLPATTPEEMAQLLDRAAIATRIAKTINEEAKMRLIAGEHIPGYTLKPGASKTTITDPNMVYTRATQIGITQEHFMETVTIGIGKLKNAIKSTGLKGKALNDEYQRIIDGASETTQTQPSITKIK